MGSFNALRRLAFVVLAATTPSMAADITVRPQFREPTADDTAKIESLYSQSVNAAELGDKFKEAQMLREALHILDITYGPMHPTTADKLDVMSNVYRDELAETLLRRALHIHESLGMERGSRLGHAGPGNGPSQKLSFPRSHRRVARRIEAPRARSAGRRRDRTCAFSARPRAVADRPLRRGRSKP